MITYNSEMNDKTSRSCPFYGINDAGNDALLKFPAFNEELVTML